MNNENILYKTVSEQSGERISVCEEHGSEQVIKEQLPREGATERTVKI